MLLSEHFIIFCSGFVAIFVKALEGVIKFRGAIIIAIIGIIGVLSGTCIHILNPYDLIYRWKLIFEKGGEIYELWRDPPVELYLRVFLWNITNKDAYMNGTDDKLKMVEVGPYVYRELMLHDNVTFNDNGTLTAIPRHPLVWVPELSEGRREDDLLILPNIALLSIADVVSDRSYFTRIGLNVIIRQTESFPLVQMTAREFMFGYSSSLMSLGNNFLPNWINFDKLGLIDRMYNFEGDYETVYTGQKLGLENIGLIEKYRGETKLPQWDSPCGDITGASDGTKFKGYTKPNDTHLFFRKSMCRAKKLIRVNETVTNGLKAYVYHLDPEADDNGRVHEYNKCFCKDPENCKPKGLLDVRGCYYGFPIALSYPHFLDGNESLSNNVIGMKPDPKLHKSYFIIQPDSGLPLELAVRFQINMHLGNIKTIANCDRFDNMVLPLLWTENRLYKLPEFLAVRFRLYLNVLPLIEKCMMMILLGGGVFFFLISLYRFVKITKGRSKYQEPWIEDDLVLNIDRKLSSYIPEKSSSLTARELEVYMDSMVPLTDDIHREHEHSQNEHEHSQDEHEHHITHDQSALVY
ncbi:scavenger receptor class B member 1-like isoform X2 [Diabrotica virgifera virgifera]|uniref:Scavenger receptor class B member 1-like isoform X2 n=1 Tax=Diabrotica virgifera virgifera TaxID=50390 RepID=A0A6P7FNK1_DIAVI|nr:scavenger receptor class B member 1-like isoform X2 [Diabrotica virgifera virgifera]